MNEIPDDANYIGDPISELVHKRDCSQVPIETRMFFVYLSTAEKQCNFKRAACCFDLSPALDPDPED
jgi:hypothetical protein